MTKLPKLIILFVLTLSSCTNSKTAKVEHYEDFFFGYLMEEKGNFRMKYPKFIIAQEGDSYKKVALFYSIPLLELLKVNNELTKRKLSPGEKVFLPQIIFHKILHGEDLDLIANLYQISKEKIIRINDLNNEQLLAGNFLKIPCPQCGENSENTFINHNLVQSSHQNNIISNLVQKDILIEENKENFMWPVKGKIINFFNDRPNERYDGVNIEADLNTPVHAAQEGKIIYAGSELKGFGNMVIIKHSNTWLSAYAHLDKFNISKGEIVKKGGVIGYIGETGKVTKPQLYFAIRKGLEPRNPLDNLPQLEY